MNEPAVEPLPVERAFVLDTSVLVHDPQALRAFRRNVVAIPIFVVMELDELKTSPRPEVASAARIASRFISGLREHGSLSSPHGVLHPELGTTFRIIADGDGGRLSHLGRDDPDDRSMDRKILESALALQAEGRVGEVVLVSKDVNLRILADFEGLVAEDYERDRVDLAGLYTGHRIIEQEPPTERGLVSGTPGRIELAALGIDHLDPNEFVVVRGGERELLLRHDAASGTLEPVPHAFPQLHGVEPRNVEQRMALSLLLDPSVDLVTLIGRAGTGKTFLALAAAIAQLSPRRRHRAPAYERVVLSKPVVAMGRDIGYLPGDLEAKMHPWMASFMDNLDQLMTSDDHPMSKGATRDTKSWEYLFHSRQLEVQPLHTIRGRSIPAAYMVIDEAQNLTPHEVKTIVTRAARGTKVILAGDPYQVDHPFLDQQSNGLVHATARLRAATITGTVFFTQGERSPLAELAATEL